MRSSHKLLSLSQSTAGSSWLYFSPRHQRNHFSLDVHWTYIYFFFFFTKELISFPHLLQVSGVVSFKCESVATLDPVTFDTPESYVALSKWTAKKAGSISFDFRTTEPNGLMLFSHGKPRQQQRKDPRAPPTLKVTNIVFLLFY